MAEHKDKNRKDNSNEIQQNIETNEDKEINVQNKDKNNKDDGKEIKPKTGIKEDEKIYIENLNSRVIPDIRTAPLFDSAGPSSYDPRKVDRPQIGQETNDQACFDYPLFDDRSLLLFPEDMEETSPTNTIIRRCDHCTFETDSRRAYINHLQTEHRYVKKQRILQLYGEGKIGMPQLPKENMPCRLPESESDDETPMIHVNPNDVLRLQDRTENYPNINVNNDELENKKNDGSENISTTEGSNDTNFKCNYCDLCFRDKETFDVHMNTEHGENTQTPDSSETKKTKEASPESDSKRVKRSS